MNYVEKAQACIKECEGKTYIIGNLELTQEVGLLITPEFLTEKTINRFYGYPAYKSRRFIFHAQTPEHAEEVMQKLLDGTGLTGNGTPITFQKAELSATLDSIALDLIEKYHEQEVE